MCLHTLNECGYTNRFSATSQWLSLTIYVVGIQLLRAGLHHQCKRLTVIFPYRRLVFLSISNSIFSSHPKKNLVRGINNPEENTVANARLFESRAMSQCRSSVIPRRTVRASSEASKPAARISADTCLIDEKQPEKTNTLDSISQLAYNELERFKAKVSLRQ